MPSTSLPWFPWGRVCGNVFINYTERSLLDPCLQNFTVLSCCWRNFLAFDFFFKHLLNKIIYSIPQIWSDYSRGVPVRSHLARPNWVINSKRSIFYHALPVVDGVVVMALARRSWPFLRQLGPDLPQRFWVYDLLAFTDAWKIYNSFNYINKCSQQNYGYFVAGILMVFFFFFWVLFYPGFRGRSVAKQRVAFNVERMCFSLAFGKPQTHQVKVLSLA